LTGIIKVAIEKAKKAYGDGEINLSDFGVLVEEYNK